MAAAAAAAALWNNVAILSLLRMPVDTGVGANGTKAEGGDGSGAPTVVGAGSNTEFRVHLFIIVVSLSTDVIESGSVPGFTPNCRVTPPTGHAVACM